MAYDETRIRRSESVLDVVARAGFRVVWVDNQSGCKGVCNGVESIRPDPAKSPEACSGGECQDGALVDSLKQLVSETPGNLLIVLHQMGNHGPAYFKRYPDAFKHYTPACEDRDLPKCSNESIVNAYDNAIRYTDHVVASLVRARCADYESGTIRRCSTFPTTASRWVKRASSCTVCRTRSRRRCRPRCRW